MKHRAFLLTLFLSLSGMNLFCEETEQKRDLFFVPIASYDHVNLEDQIFHAPRLGFAVMKGGQDTPFTDVHKQFLLTALYRPFFFDEAPYALSAELPAVYHDIDFLFDGRWERQQILMLATASSDKPAAGGLHTVQAGLGWGYELLRYSRLSFILGAAIGIGDFGFDMPNGEPLPLVPLPLIRLKFKTEWLAGFFDFNSGPNLNFTIAPMRKIRFTADMEMDNYRSIRDLIGEGVLWYRPFTDEHPLGDFAGIGLGIKNESHKFDLSQGIRKTFEQQYTALFVVLDVSALKLGGGYIFDSRELYNESERNTGKGFFISLQAMYRF